MKSYSIPILTPQDARIFFKYFCSVDAALAQRFLLGFQPDEEHLTSLLCELLDERGAELHNLPFGIRQLNDELKQTGSLLQAALSLETRTYTKYQERNLTQADLGIIVDYRDNIEPSLSFRKGVLVQAKRLFPNQKGHYSLSSLYASFDPDQHNRIVKLRDQYRNRKPRKGDDQEMEVFMKSHGLCQDSFCYLLYNPPLSVLPPSEKERVTHSQLTSDSGKIYDYTHGLFLHELLSSSEGGKAILNIAALFVEVDLVHAWARETAQTPKDQGRENLKPFPLSKVISGTDIRERSFPWFMVFKLFLGQSGCFLPEFVSLVEGHPTPLSKEFHIYPPRYVLRVNLTSGTHSENG
jgi:hypothetical protein